MVKYNYSEDVNFCIFYMIVTKFEMFVQILKTQVNHDMYLV